MECPDCNHQNPDNAKFCNECACNLIEALDTAEVALSTDGERKHATILFSDLSGYTVMAEKFDPEELKEIRDSIFSKITKIIKSYDGFIEKFIGDAIMVVFGVPKAHEDDPIRAIRAAMEMHATVETVNPQLEKKIGQRLALHTGINTGLIVTGEVDVNKGTHGMAGDAINLASRLEGLAKSSEILVGQETFNQTRNQIEFEALEPTEVKGKQESIKIYKVLSIKTDPSKTHRLQGLRSALTGRDQEMKLLAEGSERLTQGEGSIISIVGDPGVGKSRLKQEFKNTLNHEEVQWSEGHAYSYTQDMPYYPLINLLTNAFQIDEKDPPRIIKEKIEFNISYLLGDNSKHAPFIGSLFTLTYPEIENVSPEYWDERLHESIKAILSALVDRKPTVICFEDLHWADNSFIGLLQRLIKNTDRKPLFILTYRTNFKSFDDNFQKYLKDSFTEIQVKELGSDDAEGMLNSLLDKESVPKELVNVVLRKTEGNPFYIEEIINSLIDSAVLICDNGDWKLTREIIETDIPATIHGLLTARVDRLGMHLKRTLQEASVIGRAFLYRILEKVTDCDSDLEEYLSGLEGLDLIRMKTIEPEIEYIFKHALTQEVVYDGLLKSERQAIHERIGLAIEQLFSERLSEFYEILAFHFARGDSKLKAIDYLIKSGEKSLKRYAIDESHEYYEKAFQIVKTIAEKTEAHNEILIDLLNKWSMVFYYRGDFWGIVDLLIPNHETAESISNKELLGMFYAWLGWGVCQSNPSPNTLELREGSATQNALAYLEKAQKIGEVNNNLKVVCYARTWISWLLADIGDFKKGIDHGQKAHKMAFENSLDQYLYYKSLAGIGWNYIHMGHADKCISIGKELIKFGEEHSHPRCLAMGYWTEAGGYLFAGDINMAIHGMEQAVEVCIDPLYRAMALGMLLFCLIEKNNMTYADYILKEMLSLLSRLSHKSLEYISVALNGVLLIDKEQMVKGSKNIRTSLKCFYQEDRHGFALLIEYVIAKIYIEIVKGDKSLNMLSIIRNFGFILRDVIGATNKCEAQLKKVLSKAIKVGAIGYIGQANYQLALLYKKKNNRDLACTHFNEAINNFKKSGAYVYLENALEGLNSIRIS